MAEISAIRSQLARGAVFRGYGPATLAATGGLALAAAIAQPLVVPDAAAAPAAYLTLWMGTAAVCALLVGVEMVTRSHRVHTGLAQQMIWNAVQEFAPAAVAGALITAVLVGFSPESMWMLPGLWQIVFALGVFASCRFLPPPLFWVGGWYLASGLVSLAAARGELAFSPWAMGIPYGFGQLLTATILLLDASDDGYGEN